MTDTRKAVCEYTVRMFFTSDSLGVDITPSLSLVTSDAAYAGKFVSTIGTGSAPLVAANLAKDAGIKADDWRLMTREEVDQWREENEA